MQEEKKIIWAAYVLAVIGGIIGGQVGGDPGATVGAFLGSLFVVGATIAGTPGPTIDSPSMAVRGFSFIALIVFGCAVPTLVGALFGSFCTALF